MEKFGNRNASRVSEKFVRGARRCRKALLALSAATGLVSFAAFSFGDTFSAKSAGITDGNVVNGIDLSQAGSWVHVSGVGSGTSPTIADLAQFDSTNDFSAAVTFTLGESSLLTWGGIVVQSPSSNVLIQDPAQGILHLGSSGIDMTAATANLTIDTPMGLLANQTWNVQTGRVLTVSDTNSAAGTVDLSGNRLTVTGAGTTSILDNVVNSGSIVMSGSGILQLFGASNSYLGNTTINGGGTVQINSGISLGTNTSTLNLINGTLEAVNTVTNGYALGNTIHLGSGTSSFQPDAGVTLELDGTVNGALGTVQNKGAGILFLNPTSGTNTFGGGIVLTAGEIGFSQDSAIGGAATPINFNGGTLQIVGTSVNNLDTHTQGAGVNWSTFSGGFDIANANNFFTVRDNISGTSLSMTGSGVLSLQGTNSFSGSVNLNGGETEISSFGNIGGPSTAVNFNGGLLRIAGNGITSLGSLNVNTSTFNGGFDIASPANTFTIGQNLTGTNFTKNGLGSLVLTGSNNFSVATTVNAGPLVLDYTSTTTPIISTNTGILQMGGGTLSVLGNTATPVTQSFSSTSFVNGLSQVLVTPNGTTPVTLNLGPITHTGHALVQFNTSGNAAIYTANGTVGNLITTPGGSGYATYGNSDWAAVGLNQQVVPGASITTANGYAAPFYHPNAIPFGGNNSPASNGTRLPDGFVLTATTNLDMVTSGNFRFAGNQSTQTLRFNNPTGAFVYGSGSFADQTYSTGATLMNKSGSAWTIGGILITPNMGSVSVYMNTTSVGSNNPNGTNSKAYGQAFYRVQNDDMVIWQNDVTPGEALVWNNGIFDVNGNTGGVTKAGPGTMLSYAQNFYIGNTSLLGGNDIVFANSALGNVNNGTTLNLQGGTLTVAQSFGAFNGAPGNSNRPINLGNVGGNISVLGTNTFTVPGVISGLGALTLNNAGNVAYTPIAQVANITQASVGTLVLSGANTYAGGTNINAGNLQVDNQTGSGTGFGAVQVNNGGVLSGIGSMASDVFLNNGGHLQPGDLGSNGNIGTITVGSLTVNNGGVVDLDGQSHGITTNDFINVSRLLTFNAGGGLNIFQAGTPNPLQVAGLYTLADFGGGAAAATALVNQLNAGGVLLDAQGGTFYTFSSVALDSYHNQLMLQINGGKTVKSWANTTGGSYTVGSNWNPSGQPDPGAIITFGTAINAPSTVTLDGNQTSSWVQFDSAQSYTIASGTGGSLVLDNGTQTGLITDYNGSHTISAPVILNSKALASVANTVDTLTISGSISGPGSLTQSGTGTLLLLSTNTYAGQTIVSSGSLQLGNGTGAVIPTLGTSTAPIITNGTLAFDFPSTAGTQTLSTEIDGTGGIAQLGAGTTLLLKGTNTYTGTTTLLAGAIKLGNAAATGGSAIVMNSGSLLDIAGTSPIFGGLGDTPNVSGTGGTIDSTIGGTMVVTFGANGSNTTFSGVIKNTTGTVSLVKIGTGATTFNSPNTYSGATTIVSGQIFDNVTNGIPALSQLLINQNTGLLLGNNVTMNSPITLAVGANDFMDVPGSGNAVLSSNVTVSNGNYRLGVYGTGTLYVNGVQNASNAGGAVFITRGNVVFQNNSSLILSSGNGFGIGRPQGANAANAVTNLTLMNNATFTGTGTFLGNSQNEGGGVNVTLTGNSYLNAQGGAFNLNNSTSNLTTHTINLNGGTLATSNFVQTGNTATLTPTLTMRFNGGVLQSGGPSTNTFLPALPGLQVLMDAGGLKVNSNGNNIQIAPAISEGNVSSPVVADAGITKLGAGYLWLTGGFSPTGTGYSGPDSAKGGFLDFSQFLNLPGVAAQGGGGQGLSFQQAVTGAVSVTTGGSVGLDSGLNTGLTNTFDNSTFSFLKLITNTATGVGAITNGGLALSAADSATNIDFTTTTSSPGTIGLGNFTRMSLGGVVGGVTPGSALPGGVTYVGTITPAGSTYLLGGGSTLTLANNNALTGSRSVIDSNGGTVDLAGTNNYTGTTTVQSEWVAANSQLPTNNTANVALANQYEKSTLAVTNLSTNTGVTGDSLGQNSSAASNLLINGGTLQYLGTGSTTDRLFTIGATGATLDASGSGTVTFGGAGSIATVEPASTAASFTTSSTVISGINTNNLAIGMTVRDTASTGLGATGIAITAISPTSITLASAPTTNDSTANLVFGNTSRTLTLTGTNSSVNTLASILSNPVSGTLAISKTGVGQWNLAGSNAFTGGTTVSAGVLQVGNNFAFGSGGLIVNTPGIVDVNGLTPTVTQLSGNGTIDNISFGGSPTLIVNSFSSASSTFSGNIQNTTGALSLTKIGSGTLILTGASNTYTGGTFIGTNTTVQVGANGATGGVGTGNVTDNGTLAFQLTGNPTFANVVTGIGTVNDFGSGNLLVTGNSSYTGGTTITAGTYIIGNAHALGANPNNAAEEGTVLMNGGTLDLEAFNPTVAGLLGTKGSITSNLANSAETLTIDTFGTNSYSFGATINDNPGITAVLSLVKTGSGTQTLTAANTFSGTTTVSGGTLVLSNAAALLAGNNVTNNAALVANASMTLGAVSGAAGVTTITGTNTLTATSVKQLGVVNVGGTLSLSGPGSVIGANGITGVSGTLNLGATAVLQLAAGGAPSNQKALNITTGGLLDITNNSLTLSYNPGNTAGSPNAVISNYISNAYNVSGTPWSGTTGITSTLADTHHSVAFA
ncbi:MAG: autotransporter-associated beta strand repeat-containing protein, partial [Planctomycetota bacterium]|nr:autotransporter-associated beta strand repeat-containing protein [Planctomycetota bacterium]